jgi:uncharacterized protein
MAENKLKETEDFPNELLNSITHGKISIIESIREIKKFLEEQPSSEYSLVIGTDSHEKEKKGDSKTINLVTAVLVHRGGYGGKYYWRRKLIPDIHTLRDKIYSETMESIAFASFFVPLLKKELNGQCPRYKLEIHVDIGEFGDTRDMIKEAVGMVTGNGFVARIKPYSYGASHVADKHT